MIWVHTYGIGKFKHTILRTVHDTEESAKFAQEVLGGEIVAYNKVPEVRAQHAEWSDQTFGAVDKVGGVGCLKHLAKEAIEAAENPCDLSEWADIQLLLWDAMRREESQTISRRLRKSLKSTKAIPPEPKDGEPRHHIKI
ncbi:hypothetical protein STSR3_64 [Salmonella virus STSR3]|nr:hypothetical protein STSR3_64 [Salmonella virus STSR3]